MSASKLTVQESEPGVPGPTTTKPLNSLKELFGDCICVDPVDFKDLDASNQFIELNGIEFIGLGAVTDELSPKDRVYYTMQQISESAERLISIGRLVADETELARMTTESVPLDIWKKTYPNDDTIPQFHKRAISNIKATTPQDQPMQSLCASILTLLFSSRNNLHRAKILMMR